MKNHRLPFVLLATMIFLGCATDVFADLSLKWKTSPFVKPQPAISGLVTTVGCAWTAEASGKFDFLEVQLQMYIQVWDIATNGNVDYYFWKEYAEWPPNGKDYTGTETEFNGVREHTVKLKAGLHKVSCEVDGSGSSDRYPDDYEEITFDVNVPTINAGATPAGGETYMAVTPNPSSLPSPSNAPGITPPSPNGRRMRQPPAVSPTAGRPHFFRSGEKLALEDGRSLSIQEARLVLLDARGRVLRTFPPGVVVIVGPGRDVSVQSGPLNVPLGVARR